MLKSLIFRKLYYYLFKFINQKNITDPVILLSGGKGSRMSTLHDNNETSIKALILLNSIRLYSPIKNFIDYGYRNFIFALGYKGNFIIKYFETKKFWIQFKFIYKKQRFKKFQLLIKALIFY